MAARVLGRIAGNGCGVYCEPTSEGGLAAFVAVTVWLAEFCAGEASEAKNNARKAESMHRREKNMAPA
jgi:hypothetical protein